MPNDDPLSTDATLASGPFAGPEEFAQLIQDDQKHWGTLIKSLGLKLD